MIIGTGIDIVENNRIKDQLEKSGERFYATIFTVKEIEYCLQASNMNVQAQRFGARFAAKEAFFKALGTGWRDGLKWTDVEVVRDTLGKPSLILKNKALEAIQKLKVNNIQVSISHGKEIATAIVILEK